MSATATQQADAQKHVHWNEQRNIIFLNESLVSTGFTGEEWIRHFFDMNVDLSQGVKEVLLSPDFKPATKGTVHQVAIFRGDIWSNSNRSTENIKRNVRDRCVESGGDLYRFTASDVELAMLLRDKFTRNDELSEAGFGRIIAVHDPVVGANGNKYMVSVDCYNGHSQITTLCEGSSQNWPCNCGFMFVLTALPSDTRGGHYMEF